MAMINRLAKTVDPLFVYGYIDGVTWSAYLSHFHVNEIDLPKIIVLDAEVEN